MDGPTPLEQFQQYFACAVQILVFCMALAVFARVFFKRRK